MMAGSRSKKGLLFLVAGLFCLLLAGSIVRSFSGRWEKGSSGAVAGPAPITETETGSIEAEDQEPAQWVIYITGAVLRPGVYSLPSGSRVYQAVEQSGGLTGEADPEAFNMALPLSDGMHIHVPRKGESQGQGPSIPGKAGSAAGGSIDLNRADAAALESLPGIGPKIAGEIIRHREERGRFSSVEDLLTVKGIGPAKLSAIRGLVTVSR